MDSFKFYSERMKNDISESDHTILDDYFSSQIPELKEFWANAHQYRK